MTTGLYPLSLHDALPILQLVGRDVHDQVGLARLQGRDPRAQLGDRPPGGPPHGGPAAPVRVVRLDHDALVLLDRKSTRLNSSHRCISYAVFCLKKKTDRW